VWREHTTTGDRAELNLLGSGEQLAWARVCAEDETCTARRCAMVRGGCYLDRARDAAARAPLVVANHALVLSDARSRNRLLPDVDIVVADEAHHLDEVASHVFGVRLTAVQREGISILGVSHEPSLADAGAELESALAELRGLDAAVNRVVHLPPRGEICWLSLDQTGAVALQSAPAHAGAYIDRALAR